MHARRVLRGIAATLLSAALVAGGALGTPAFAADEIGLAEGVATAPTLAAAEEPSEEVPAPEVSAPDNGAEAPSVADDADVTDVADGTEGAISEPSEGVSGPADEDQELAPALDSAPVQEEVPAAPVVVAETKMALKTTIVPKKHLAVEVSATNVPEDIAEFSAALIKQGDEATLEKPGSAVPALLNPAPQAQNGSAAFTLTAAMGKLSAGEAYVVVLWPTRGKATEDTIIARSDLAMTPAQWQELFGPPTNPDWNAKSAVGSFDWSVRGKFQEYVTGGIAKGKIAVKKPATGSSVYKYPQVSNTWNPDTKTGTVKFAGNVNFWGHGGTLNLDLANPEVRVTSASAAELSVPYDGATLKIANIALGKRATLSDGSVRFEKAVVTLTKDGADKYFQEYLDVTSELAKLTFTIGADSKTDKPVKPPVKKPGTTHPKDKTKPIAPLPPAPATGGEGGAQAAGSLSWGVSSAFSKYVTGPIAKGAVATSGVGNSGGGYLFPQAAGGSWDVASQTGSVQYSGVISYTGHKGLLSESMANPMIQVTGPDSGVIYSGGAQWGTLNLGAATKSVGPNGEVTWSGVPVNGGFSGGASGGNQYTLAADPLTFTVGAASGVSYGGTEVSNDSLKRTAAATAPTTTGIRILTNPKKLVPGGEIELEAPGFTAKEREALVVLYPGVMVLDEAAGADAAGTVRWIGTIPEDLPLGEYVITVQGSTDAGAVFEVRKPEPKAKSAAKQQRVAELAEATTQQAPAAAGVLPEAGAPVWVWWTASLALLAVAGTMGGLVAAQRKKAAAFDAAGGTD